MHLPPSHIHIPPKATFSVPVSAATAEPSTGREPALSYEALAEFRLIYRQAYGVDLTPEEARIRAGQLVELFRILLRPPR